MLKNTKDIIKKKIFPDYSYGTGWFRLVYYLQKKEDFWEVSAG